MVKLTDDEIIELFDKQLPDLLERRPELEPRIYRAFMKTFATKEDVAAILAELRDFRAEVNQRFNQMEKRFEKQEERMGSFEERMDGLDERVVGLDERVVGLDERVVGLDERVGSLDKRVVGLDERVDSLEERMEAGFLDLHRAIDRLGGRWGIRNESIFRQTMAELLGKTFGLHVEERTIQGEQFDCVISDGEHILVEISASVGPKIQERLERKRQIYAEATGIVPSRVILVTAAIHSHRAQALKEAGFEVIEPEEDTLW
jgi:hypothetical protein